MCVGVPMRLSDIDGIAGRAQDGDRIVLVDLSLTPDARVGDWVLAHLGTAREILPETEAQLIRRALDGLSAIMAGGEAGHAFADLDTRAPQLPPHLQAALDAGRTTG